MLVNYQKLIFHTGNPTYSNDYLQGVTNCCQISYAPTEILLEINEITRFLKSEIKKYNLKLVWKPVKSRKFTFPVMLKILVTLSSGK